MDSYTEHINATKAEKLLCNFDTLAVLFDEKDEFKNRDTQKTILKKLIIKTRHQGRTSYRTGKNKEYGRLYADSASLQQLKKPVNGVGISARTRSAGSQPAFANPMTGFLYCGGV